MNGRAILLADDSYRGPSAKTSHGLVRGPSRFDIVAVVDARCAGQDAGTLLDGRRRGIPVVADLEAALAHAAGPVDACVVGVATPGGILPPSLERSLIAAARKGITLVNGLHRPLAANAAISTAATEGGARIVDFRQTRPVQDLHHWTGEILQLETPRVAVLGTDCCIGKRTTCNLLRQELAERDLGSEMIYTGQTGWLQGHRHGFFFDATPNDFVCGELERVVLECARQSTPDLILLEGQSSFHNPAGPCGAEFIVSAGARHVVLQHAPGRSHFDDLEHLESARIPDAAAAIRVAEALGAQVCAVTLNGEGLEPAALKAEADRLERELARPVCRPLEEGVGRVVDALLASIGAVR